MIFWLNEANRCNSAAGADGASAVAAAVCKRAICCQCSGMLSPAGRSPLPDEAPQRGAGGILRAAGFYSSAVPVAQAEDSPGSNRTGKFC